MTTDEALPTFIAEAGELLREMEAGLLECTESAASEDNINRLFRCAHTIKGSAGLFGLSAIVEFVHSVEALLDRVRQGHLQLNAQSINVLLKCKDHIGALVDQIVEGSRQLSPELTSRGRQLLSDLTEVGGEQSFTPAPRPEAAATGGAPTSADREWHISLRFGREVLTAGMDPMGFLRYLSTFGEIAQLTLVDDLPAAVEELDPEKCYVGFEFDFVTDATRERIEAAFDFVRDDCTLKLTPQNPPGEPAAGVETQERPAPRPDSPASTAGARDNRTIRVDATKLDALITYIGELITAAATANLAARRSGNRDLEEQTATVSALIEQVREASLQLRMVKIGATFSRFRRVVHDLSAELGKDIELLVSGEDTELDKTVVERITDPLTHLVRNALDHGIEAADVRQQRGKSRVGQIKLNAYHESGTIIIEVSDDGGGLRRERILAKAIERGLVSGGQSLSEQEILNLVFEPGFSTAEAVTNLSGRGVGMDVVKRNITALRGDVAIKSTEGAGTTVTVRLPLTLAIINGFQVGVGKSIFVLPLEAIEECVDFSTAPGHDFTDLRGAVLPFVRLSSLFGIQAAAAARQSIVVVRGNAGQRLGVVVDSLLGEFQTVIKPLGKIFQRLDCISGSSILGTGEVALILDVPALVRRTAQQARAPDRADSGPLAVQI
jgi:two-component system, chemotaxis family, sensor kinase CheA